MPLVVQEGPFRASYALGESISLKTDALTTISNIPEAGTHKEDKRIRIHEQPQLGLQSLLHTTEVE